jgi:hypothetical protein
MTRMTRIGEGTKRFWQEGAGAGRISDLEFII